MVRLSGAIDVYLYRYQCAAVLMIVSFASPCASQRSLNWNRGLFEGDFRANANAAVLASACSDTRFASLLANLKIYAQGDDNYAQNALAVALCSFLMPRNSFDASSLFDSILRNVTVTIGKKYRGTHCSLNVDTCRYSRF